MHRCSRCERDLPDNQFYLRPSGGHQGYCRQCRREYNREWYRKNKQRHLASVRRNASRYQRTKRRVVDELKSNPCTDCGNQFPPSVMDFDHVRGEKVAEVSALMGSRASLDRILTEVEKCDLVCSNCHRLRTAHRRGE